MGCGGGARPWRCGLTPCFFKDYDVDPRDIRVIYLGAADTNPNGIGTVRRMLFMPDESAWLKP
jgi:hypothetical protein